jgi:hypothetical protein
VGEIREAISAISEKSAVAAVLDEQLLKLPCLDTSRHLLLLSTIGELGQESSIAVLERFTWLRDEEVLPSAHIATAECDFSATGMLQARAAEMLVWVLKGKQDDLVLRMIRDHPQRVVRAAAIDSYLFQRGDTPGAIDFLRSQVSQSDHELIGLPRFGADTDRETFDRLTKEYELAHKSEAPRPQKRESIIWPAICVVSVIGLGVLLALRTTRRTKTRWRI